MNPVQDAAPGDIYADKKGDMWRVKLTIPEACVFMEPLKMNETDLRPNSLVVAGVNAKHWKKFYRIWRPKRSQ